jgi:hypothetical protein
MAGMMIRLGNSRDPMLMGVNSVFRLAKFSPSLSVFPNPERWGIRDCFADDRPPNDPFWLGSFGQMRSKAPFFGYGYWR